MSSVVKEMSDFTEIVVFQPKNRCQRISEALFFPDKNRKILDQRLLRGSETGFMF